MSIISMRKVLWHFVLTFLVQGRHGVPANGSRRWSKSLSTLNAWLFSVDNSSTSACFSSFFQAMEVRVVLLAIGEVPFTQGPSSSKGMNRKPEELKVVDHPF